MSPFSSPGTTVLTGEVSTILANAAADKFWSKLATIIRDIAGRHMFDNANKRTTQAIVKALMRAKRDHLLALPPASSEPSSSKWGSANCMKWRIFARALRGF